MADQLRPIFPPDELNYSAQALEASTDLLDEETRAILAADRARLTQTTALGTFTLSRELSLSEETTTELQEALIARLRQMSPAYHGYINQLIGSAATSLMNQAGVERPQVVAALPAIASPRALEQISVQPDSSEVEPTIFEPSPEAALAYDPKDILKLKKDSPKLYDYKKTHRNMSKFLKDVLPELSDEVVNLEPRIASLLVYQIIEVYMTARIPQATPDRKATQKERIERYTGLYVPVASVEKLLKDLSISGASLHIGMGRVAQSVGPLLDTEKIFRIARITAEHGPVEEIFTSNLPTIESEPNNTQQEVSGDHFATVENTDGDWHTPEAPGSQVEEEGREFYTHLKVPANMRNFLLSIYPAHLGDRILELPPMSASFLTYQLIEEYRSLWGAHLTNEQLQRRCKWLTQWAGLYAEAVDEELIARREVVAQQLVRRNIEKALQALEKNIPMKSLRELLENANFRSTVSRAALSS